MKPMLLVALREFRQITSTRSFWITLLFLPIAIAASQAMAFFLRPPPGVAYVVVDESARYAPAIQRRIALDQQRQVLGAISEYADKWKIAPPGAVWAGGPRWFTDADLAAFQAAGGQAAAEAQLAKLKPEVAPDFNPSSARYIAIDPPAGVKTTDGPKAFGASIAPHLRGDVMTAAGERPLALAAYVPANIGAPGASIGMWTNGRSNPALMELVRDEVSRQLRTQALAASGLDAGALARVQAVSAPVSLTVPERGSGRDRMLLRSALPLALSYLLLVSLMISGSWMLQGLIEERSNKLIEAVLACVTPDDLLYGKLIGVVSVGLLMIVAWIACAVGAAFAMQGVVADFLRPALGSLDSPWIGLTLLYLFVAGYLAVSLLFLAVGAISESMRDAQGYLTPMILALTLPFVGVMQAVLRDPDGPLPRVFSWIPPYSSFTMMARLGGGVSRLEVAGSCAVLAAFILLELVLVGRLFKAALLQAGQPIRLRDLPRLMRNPAA